MDLIEANKQQYNIANRHPWELARIEVVFILLKRLCPDLLKRKCCIIDIGCGDTFFVEQLSKRIPHAEFIAIDTGFTKEVLSKLRNKYQNCKIRVYKSVESALSECKESIDLVLLLDVIEHVKDDVGFLKKMRRELFTRDETTLILTAPAYQFLFSMHDVYLKHFRRYSSLRVERLLTEAGFDIELSGYFFGLLVIPRLLKKLKEIIINLGVENESGVGLWKSLGLFDIIIKNILIIDFKVSWWMTKLGISLPGLSAYAICKKTKW